MFSVNFTIDDSSPLLVYEPQEGAWFQRGPQNEQTAPKYSHQTLTVTYSPNANASFSFNGTSLTLTGGIRPDYGNFTVTIDESDVINLTANAQVAQFQQTLFEIRNLTQGPHTIRLTNTDTDGRGFDIDSISWVSSVPSGSNETETTPAPPVMVFQDTQNAVTYLPKGSWNLQPKNLLQFAEGTGHSTSQVGASMNFTFIGQVVCLYGTTGPSNTRAYTVQIDSGPVQVFSARRAIQRQQQMLFHTDGLAPGQHTIILTNGNGNEKRSRIYSRQQDDVDLLEFDYATVWSTDAQRPQVSSASSPPSATATTTPSKVETRLRPGAIVAISLACVLFVALLIVLWALNKRNKTLWMRLQKGYMVQSQFDTQSTSTLSRPSGNPEMRQTLAPPTQLNLDHNNDSNRIFPIGSTAEGLQSRESALTRIEPYPFTGFGRDRSSSKSSTQSSTNSSPGNPYPDGAYPPQTAGNDGIARGENGAPERSGTIDTVSTLVAENGSQTASERSSWKIFPSSRLAGARSPGEMQTPPTPTPTLASNSSGSHSTRRRTMRLKLPTARSSSPSETRLLRDSDQDQPASGSDGENDEHDTEANFYASEAPFFDDQRMSPSVSVANTQSDILTPAGRRYSSLRSTVLGSIPSRVDEDYEREMAEQLQSRYLQRTRSQRGSVHTGQTVDELDYLHGGNVEGSTLVEVPAWTDHPTVESPPPLYTSNTTSLADRRQEDETRR